ncbi:helix-turn-helix domain-containing protein [Butyrivibrio sp. MC2021]|uniref:helix-turn-helix domain-containing protein n=1 Tax=Butyrivibrio sp. MC2021 TaxID=1408306 RepID=UPI00068622EC|nr:helix-turn-helix transcriptional regulator [Butyrivibrio sp. MC2021]
MMTPAYSRLYLDDAMHNLGELTEYTALVTPEITLDELFKMFTISGLAARFEKGDPAVVSGMSGTELHHRIMEKCYGEYRKWPPALVKYDTEAEYWYGYILAYVQWEKSCRFSDILNKVSFSDLEVLYPAFHTVSEHRAFIEIENRMNYGSSQVARIQEYRKRLCLSQRELAEDSGVNVRTLQQYEIRDKDINKASFEKIIALAKALKCRPEDIMEL